MASARARLRRHCRASARVTEGTGSVGCGAFRRGLPTAGDFLDGLVGKAAPGVFLRMWARQDVEGLLLVLERSQHGVHEGLAVFQVRAKDVLAGGADGQAVARTCSRGERSGSATWEAFSESVTRERYSAASWLSAMVCDPVGEPVHELTVVVRHAGREVEVAILADGADGAGGDAELAVDAWVVVDRPARLGILGVAAVARYEAAEDRVVTVRCRPITPSPAATATVLCATTQIRSRGKRTTPGGSRPTG